MLKILSIFGTRPEAIKMAPVIQELNAESSRVQSVICSVGQHREMLDQVLSLFQITPDYELKLMQPNQTLSQLSAWLFGALDPVVDEVSLIGFLHRETLLPFSLRQWLRFITGFRLVTSKRDCEAATGKSLFRKRSIAGSPIPLRICISRRPKAPAAH